MELESITAKRRLATFAAHFTATIHDPVSTASLVPLNCSSSLNSVIRRHDNKITFARQASSTHGYFMRQASADEPQNQGNTSKNSVIRRCDNKMYFARQASSVQGFFMRRASTKEDAASTKCSATKTNGLLSASLEPLVSRPEYAPPHFSRAAKEEVVFSSDSPNQEKETWKEPATPRPDLPKLSKIGNAWSPKSNVAEFEHNYVVALELPGASINDIRVEVDNRDLTVRGRRTTICPYVAARTNDPIFGSFKFSWPLPMNVNKDNVSAEFMDGILRIVISKL